MIRRPTAARTAALALLALVSLAGCGDDQSSSGAPSPEPSSSSAPATTGGESSAAPASPESTAAGEPSGDEIDASEFIDVYSRALDNATTATISMTVDGPTPSSVDGQIDFTAEPPNVTMNFSSDGSAQEQELILVDGEIYFRTPDGTYYNTPASSSPLGAGGSALDPRALLDSLSGSIVSGASYGTEDVDGESLDHYGVVLDAAALQAASGTGAPDAGVDTFGFDIWVDGDGLLRRVVIGLGEQGTVTVRYDDWGQPVDISAPPADQVQQVPGSSPS